MTENIKTFAFYLLIATVFIFVAGLLGRMIGYKNGYIRGVASCQQIEADTVYLADTASYGTHGDSIPEEVTKDSIVPYPVPVPYPVTKDSIVHDTVFLYLPMEWKHAYIKDTADIYYHGIMAGLDSTKFYFRNTVITNTVTETKYQVPRLTLGLGAGALYQQRAVHPYLFSELRWNMPRTTFAAFGAIDPEGRLVAGLNVTYRINLIK